MCIEVGFLGGKERRKSREKRELKNWKKGDRKYWVFSILIDWYDWRKIKKIYNKKLFEEPALASEKKLKGSLWNLFWPSGDDDSIPQQDVIHLVTLSYDTICSSQKMNHKCLKDKQRRYCHVVNKNYHDLAFFYFTFQSYSLRLRLVPSPWLSGEAR